MEQPLRIGVIAPPWIPVPPPAYGGTEQVVARMVVRLAERGHHVHLVAAPGSLGPVEAPPGGGSIRVTCPLDDLPGLIGDRGPEWLHVTAALEALSGEDLIIDHSGPLGAMAAGSAGPPVLNVVHGPFEGFDLQVYRAIQRLRPQARFIAISRDHCRAARGLNVVAVCHNGIDVSSMPFSDAPDGPLVFLGRMAPGKGPDAAIRIARAAGVPLRIAAKCREPAERAFFAECVEPVLGDGVEWLGEVAVAERDALLAGARGLVFPISWPEPFGMVMIEAMACGTPVLALACGAAPEVVEDGVTGFVREDEAGLVDATPRIAGLDPAACRAHVETCFSDVAMAIAYERAAYGVLAERAGGRTPTLGRAA
jgi:glycosyltransferase involved in cell wall biosynthesis